MFNSLGGLFRWPLHFVHRDNARTISQYGADAKRACLQSSAIANSK